jgi:hypothetical protein
MTASALDGVFGQLTIPTFCTVGLAIVVALEGVRTD